MNDSIGKKNVFILVFEIFLIVLGIGGITFAFSKLLNNSSQTLVKASEYNVDYIGDKEIHATNLEPISDSKVGYNTTEGVVRLEFSLKGVSTNKESENLIYDIMINDIDIDCALLNKYTKWNLYKNGNLISTGSLDPKFDGDILGDNMTLTSIQQDLPSYKDDYDNYVLLFWISEACDNLETCERVDQSNIAGSKMSMNVFVALYSGDKQEYKRVPNYDTSCANRPELYDKMVPVTYKNGEWVVANVKNSSDDYLWYDYGNSKWANAVILKDSNNLEVGSVVDKNNILGFYVWIPRYRYKMWNVDTSDSYNALDDGIQIQFEGGLNSTNTEYKNGEYLTHPAFSDDLRGFWVSKYEISMDDDVKFVSGVDIYTNQELNSYKTTISGLSSSYQLEEKIDSHIISNLEWGAILYLSHSKYGVCSGDGCVKLEANFGYTSGSNKWDSTTRNVFGVYDMAGGASEYAVGKYNFGNAMNEVMNNGVAWYGAYSVNSESDYAIRGGCSKGLFYFGDLSMSNCENSTRAVINSK